MSRYTARARKRQPELTWMQAIIFELSAHVAGFEMTHDSFHTRHCKRMFEYWADELDREVARLEMAQ